MRTLGNIIWHIPFLGFLFSLAYALGGSFFCITIIGIPIGIGWLQFSLFLLSPFSKAMVSREDLDLLTGESQSGGMQAFSTIVRILYFPFGLFAAIGALCTIIGEFISIIGIPCGIVWAKSLSTIFNPINKVCVPRAVAMEIERIKEAGTLEKYISQNTDNTDTRMSITNEYIKKAQAKSDEELKDILRQKDDYNPQLVIAAEKELHARITGTEIVEEYQPKAFDYNNTFDFIKLRGEVLIMIGVLLPTVLIFILNLLSDIYIWGFKCSISPNIDIIIDTIYIFICITGMFLIFNGFFKVKKEPQNNNYIGITLLLISSFLLLISTILKLLWDDSFFTHLQCYSDYKSLFHISWDTIKTITSYTDYILSICPSLFIMTGIILWKYLNKSSKLNKIGVLFICFASIIEILYTIFYSNIYEYVMGDIQENYSSMLYLNYIKTISYIFLSIYGWYKFIGLDTRKNIINI